MTMHAARPGFLYMVGRAIGHGLKNGPVIHEIGHTLTVFDQQGQMKMDAAMDKNTLRNHEPDTEGAHADAQTIVKTVLIFAALLVVAGFGALLLGQVLAWMAGG